MNKDELIEYAIRTSEVIKEEKISELINYFHKKQERIEYLERSNDRREDTILEQRQEISNLKDNWVKLKEYTKEIISTDNELYGTDLLDKMQELEGSDSNGQ